ncbi:hypothetical protein [Treponema sp.]|nr:hypothetical protein [Treponema sp.]
MIKTATYGICKLCGCTANNPCYNPKVGFCWWTDEAIKNDKDTTA